ncbi:MAG: hypothetical protein V1925_00635 [Candidatus Omnitrophota bacterium]
MRLRLNNSLTLVELLIALILLFAVVMGFSSIDLFSRRQLLNSERQIKLQNEVSTLIEHMSKNIQMAAGTASDFPVQINNAAAGGPLMAINMDSDGDGATDKIVAYQYRTANYEVAYYDDYSGPPGLAKKSETIATKIKSCRMLQDPTRNWVYLEIVSCWLPAEDPAYYTNPCVTMSTRVTMLSVSLN